MSAAQRELQLQTLEAALTMRAARDPQKQAQAEHDLKSAVKQLSSTALWELTRAMDLVQSALAGENWGRP